MSIKTRVRVTSETFMGDVEVQHRGHRVRLIREVASQLDVPTLGWKKKNIDIGFARKRNTAIFNSRDF